MSDRFRNAMIRIALIAMFACYYVGGLVADNPAAADPVAAADEDLRFDLQRRLANEDQFKERQDPLIPLLERELLRRNKPAAAAASVGSGSLELSSARDVLRQNLRELREGIYQSKFESSRSDLASRSAALALLSEYCGQEETCRPSEADQWQPLCDALRDAALELNQVCHHGSQTAAVAALIRTEQFFDRWLAAAESS